MNNLNFLKRASLVLLGAVLTFSSCKKDDKKDPIIDFKATGFYVSGTATADEDLIIGAKQVVEPSSDFATKVERDGMYYGIHYLSAGTLAFSEVTDTEEITLGATEITPNTQDIETGEPFTFDGGTLVSGGTETYTVASAGLYYIMIDQSTSKFWVMKIEGFEINATGDVATFVSGDATAAVFEAKMVELRAPFKVRINTAWKFVLEDVAWNPADMAGFDADHVRPVISYGGSVGALTADGGDITIETDQLLNFSFNWMAEGKGIETVTIVTEDAGELPPPEFPEALYMTGAALGNGAWDWGTNGIQLTPVHSNTHLFASVQWIEVGDDVGFKFSPELAWGKDFGIGEETATAGVYAKGTGNVTVAEAGYYTIVVNYIAETVEVTPVMIYGIGDAFGGWDAAVEANLFTVDNVAKVITSPAFTADGALRMHLYASTLTNADGGLIDWWQAELNVIDGNIEYRGDGDDQAAPAVTAGQTVTLDFINGTGTIQ